jgi:hypothetical protein
MKSKSHIVVATSFVLCVLVSSCAQEEAAAHQPAVAAQASQATTAQAPATNVSKIVFVDENGACECTRERVEISWAALQSALDGRKDIPIERIYNDTEPEKVAPYKQMRAFMVIPAVYFLDGSGALLDRLQGEITAERFAKALE